MGETEIILFTGLITLAIVALIIVTVALVMQYRKRKIMYDNEKRITGELHKNELLNVKVEVQEETMQHIGVEIHDSIAQKLTLVSLHLQQLEYENKHPGIKNVLTESNALINESLNDLRLLSRRLLKQGEEKTDIVACIKRECDRLNQLQLCRMHFTADGTEINMDTQIVHTLLRIVQEALQNSLKHAACKNININITSRHTLFTLVVSDDGRGFNPGSAETGNGIGLKNIKKRAGIIGAVLTHESAPGRGTRVTITLPQNDL
jgi:signal transduction histidine kinase